MWDSAVVMAKYMEHSGLVLRDPASPLLLELGSGCALAGLAFAMRGARVVLTDLPAVAEQLTSPNVQVRPDKIVGLFPSCAYSY